MQPDLLEKLAKAATDCRELLTELHRAQKDLKTETKVAEETHRRLTQLLEAIGERFTTSVNEQLESMKEDIANKLAQYVTKQKGIVDKSFVELMETATLDFKRFMDDYINLVEKHAHTEVEKAVEKAKQDLIDKWKEYKL